MTLHLVIAGESYLNFLHDIVYISEFTLAPDLT